MEHLIRGIVLHALVFFLANTAFQKSKMTHLKLKHVELKNYPTN